MNLNIYKGIDWMPLSHYIERQRLIAMLDYMDYLNVPAKVTLILIGAFFISQTIGEFVEFKGKVVPEFLKIRKYCHRKKKEREMLYQVPDVLARVEEALNEYKAYYTTDNIAMRNDWICSVNDTLKEYGKAINKLDEKLDKNNADTLSLIIDNKRNIIIDFASNVINKNNRVTREQYNRILRLYDEYEKLIAANGLSNGEIDIAHRIIVDSYESHMKDHSFIEDTYNYNQ